MKCYLMQKECVDPSITLCSKNYYNIVSRYSTVFGKEYDFDVKYTPVKIAFYIRTIRSNLILLNKYSRIYYSTGVYESDTYFSFDEMGVLYVRKIFPEIFDMDKSKKYLEKDFHIFPVGAFCFDNSPYVCYNVIIPDNTPLHILKGHTFSNIWGLSISDPIIKAMSPTFVITKGETK